MTTWEICSEMLRKFYTRLLIPLHPFNGLFSRTTWISRHQKGKPFWILLDQEMIGWQWHQLDHMQIICTLLQTDNHANTSPLKSFYRPDALHAAQPTTSKHWRMFFHEIKLLNAEFVNLVQKLAKNNYWKNTDILTWITTVINNAINSNLQEPWAILD